eukprot:496574-Hanusia_phi.AAC.3
MRRVRLLIVTGAASMYAAHPVRPFKTTLTKYQALTRPPPLSAHSARRASHDRKQVAAIFRRHTSAPSALQGRTKLRTITPALMLPKIIFAARPRNGSLRPPPRSCLGVERVGSRAVLLEPPVACVWAGREKVSNCAQHAPALRVPPGPSENVHVLLVADSARPRPRAERLDDRIGVLAEPRDPGHQLRVRAAGIEIELLAGLLQPRL